MHRQTSIFDILPSVEDTPTQTYIYDASWDEENSQCNSVREQVTYTTKDTAHEHSDNNSSDVAEVTSLSSNTGVREQIEQGFESAHEHIDVSEGGVAYITTSLLDTGESAQLSNNPINGCNGHQQPTQKQPAHWVEKYWVGASKKHWYYRYAFMNGRKQQRTHIGPVSCKTAIAKRDVVVQMIIDDAAPEDIMNYLKQKQN